MIRSRKISLMICLQMTANTVSYLLFYYYYFFFFANFVALWYFVKPLDIRA